MKTIRINYLGFWSDFDPLNNMFYNILKERYHVEISDSPDFLFCSCLSEPFEYALYDCVRILFVGENLAPDFTAFDYVIGFDDITFADRYLQYPLSIYSTEGPYYFADRPSEEEAYSILKEKNSFCNFVYSHQSNANKREELFYTLSKYKRVEAAGTFLNNQADGKNVRGKTKFELLRKSKFTIAGESVVYPGFNTEKIRDPFDHYSIPIYAGDPNIKSVFNPKSFIYMEDFQSTDELLDYVIELDQNDQKYVEMLMEPPVLPGYCEKKHEELRTFLYNIFDQTTEQAQRRMKCYASYWHNEFLKEYNRYHGSLYARMLRKLKNVYQKLKKK